MKKQIETSISLEQQEPLNLSTLIEEKKKINNPIGEEQVKKAQETLEKYKQSKSALDTRVISNEEWFRQRHWEQVTGTKKTNKPKPVSAWLFNMILNKHADAKDNYPEPNVLPRAADDKEDAKSLSDIIPVILENNKYKGVYSDAWWDKLKFGTSIREVSWNKELECGLGDIDIKTVDILNIYWQPGIRDIQDSRNLYKITLVDNETLKTEYPDIEEYLGTVDGSVKQYIHDDQIDTQGMSVVVDWYYKKKIPVIIGGQVVGTKDAVHLVKFCNDYVLYSSENEGLETLYDHGKYPFVIDVLFPIKDCIGGFGYIDMSKWAQMDIDKLNQIIMWNAFKCGNPKTFIAESTDINMDDYLDPETTIVRCQGGVGQDRLVQEKVQPLPPFIQQYQQMKIDELKETSGNRDFSQGGTQSGVTAASAIAALQEAGSKLSRDMIDDSYAKESEICYMVLELIRQFYDETRTFRITGLNGQEEFVDYNNSHIKPLEVDNFGVASTRRPVFDIKIVAQKSSPFNKIAQNELAKELYSAGVFNPEMADQALVMLSMMDFEGKDIIEQKISQNSMLLNTIQQQQQMIMQQASMIDQLKGSNLVEALVQSGMGEMQQQPELQLSSNHDGAGLNIPLSNAVHGAVNTTATTARDKAQNVARPK